MGTILHRVGGKNRLAHLIIRHFPNHDTYIEPFFGAGGIFFNKPKAKHNILNDNDKELINFWQIVMNRKDELVDLLKQTPASQDIFNYWRKTQEQDPLKKALRFFYLSTTGYLGKTYTFKINLSGNTYPYVVNRLDKFMYDFSNCVFTNYDYKDLFKNIAIRRGSEISRTFIYADPPYYTKNKETYPYNSFTLEDTRCLLETLINFGARFAISEFAKTEILELVKEYNLNIIPIRTRTTWRDTTNTEILIINYNSKDVPLL